MPRLIDADAAYKAACEGADNWDGGCSPYRDDCIREEMDKVPTASPWHRVEEPPKEDGWYILGFLSRWKNGSWWIPKFPDYWMTSEPPKEG